MKTRSFTVAAACAAAHVRILFLSFLFGFSGAGLAATDAAAAGSGAVTAGSLSVLSVWGRATPPGVSVGGGYFTIVNHGRQPDTLVSISSPVAAAAELHRSTLNKSMSSMRAAGQIVIAPGHTVKAEPGGLHVMLMGLKTPLVADSKVPLTLQFRRAGAVTVQMDVQPLAPPPHETQAGH